MNERRAVITGIGSVSCIGNDLETISKNTKTTGSNVLNLAERL